MQAPPGLQASGYSSPVRRSFVCTFSVFRREDFGSRRQFPISDWELDTEHCRSHDAAHLTRETAFETTVQRTDRNFYILICYLHVPTKYFRDVRLKKKA